MTTDKKTLADVQPGGRVRLGHHHGGEHAAALAGGDARVQFEEWASTEGLSLDRGKLGNYVYESAAKAWLAWKHLAAQPSPAGQGGARRPVPAPGKGEGSKGWNACRDAMLRGEGEHLAARRPVGQDPVAWIRATLVETSTAEVGYLIKCGSKREHDEDVPLYAAPPAQVVGLEQFREAVAEWWSQCQKRRTDSIGGPAKAQAEAACDLAEAARLLALIDSKKVVDLGQIIEQIAQQWDGCAYDAVGETIDIGQAIRAAGKRLIDSRVVGNG